MIELQVNGKTARADVDPTTPLLYVLRDDLGLHGAKFGCGLGQCGSCTVLLDDRPVFACLLPVGSVGARSVTTVEGLGSPSAPGDVQKAFLQEQAGQCAYCIPGMIARAEALLRQTVTPTEHEMRKAMAPSLCRCGTHMRILRAVRRAAVMRGGGVIDPAEPVT